MAFASLSSANFFGKTEMHLLRPTMHTLSSSVMISRALSRRRLLKYCSRYRPCKLPRGVLIDCSTSTLAALDE
ncbi:hypothetical protein SDJN02_16762, partial [Cucurbita argyrosperma subsp. argyrosperma]